MPDAKSKPETTPAKPVTPEKTSVPKPTKPPEPPKAPEPKTAPAPEGKKPEEKAAVNAAKPSEKPAEKKPEEKSKPSEVAPAKEAAPEKDTASKAPPAKADSPKKPEPKTTVVPGPKKQEDKPKTQEAAPAPEEKSAKDAIPSKVGDKIKTSDVKVPPVGPQKQAEKASAAPVSKAEPEKKEDSGKTAPTKAPPLEKQEKSATKADASKDTKESKPSEEKSPSVNDSKPKETATEPPKGVKITQIFADRLGKPTQEDLQKLPIPKEGEGFSMRLHPAYFFEFLDHPFSVNRETDDYRELYDSIKENGINEPIKARPREGGGLELISGHRRHDVAMQLNYPVPVVIVQADNDSAQIEVVDGNLHRKDIPTSELARAAKMKIEAMTRKAGRRSKMEQLASPQKRTDQIVAEEMGYSRTQLTRLVRIDSLVPEMKKMVDDKKMPFNVAVELSYMKPEEQKDLVDVMNKEQTVPSLSQAQQMKDASQKAAKAAKEAEKATKPPLQVVSSPAKSESAPAVPAPTAMDTKTAPTTTTLSTPLPPAPKPPAPVDAKKFASIMKAKPEPELKVIFTGAELKDFFPGKTPTVPEVKSAVFEALGLRKRLQEKQAKKQEVTAPVR